MTQSILLYGANGYTGVLVSELAKQRNLDVILAGRNGDKVRPLAQRLDLPWRSFSLDDPSATQAGLDGVGLVLHLAGPFSATSAPMVQACLDAGVHYLDITGEIDVFENTFARNDDAKAKSVTLISGVGFDVVPTDAVAARLNERLPDATHLELAFFSRSGTSAGTTRSMIEGLPGGGRERQDGDIVSVPPALHEMEVPFASGPRHVVNIPWGDVSTAFWTTGIPNIRTFMGARPEQAATMRRLGRVRGLLGLGPVQRVLKHYAGKIEGPDAQRRAKFTVEVWGRARNAAGEVVEERLTTPEGYTFTADASLRAAQRVLAGTEAGAHTPSTAFGSDFVESCDDVVRHPSS